MIIDLKPYFLITCLLIGISMLYCAKKKDDILTDDQIIQLQKQELYQITDIQAQELTVIKQILVNRQKALKDKNDKLEAELKLKNESLGATTDQKDLMIRKLQHDLDSTRIALDQANAKVMECKELLNNPSIGASNPESTSRFAAFIEGAGVTKYEESVPFVPGSASVGPKGKKILRDFAKHIEGLGDAYVIQVIGNTDSIPIRGELAKKYPTNWELSVARSVAVVKYLTDHEKVNPKNIIVGGKAEYNPLVSNSTSKNRSENRRVDLLLSH